MLTRSPGPRLISGKALIKAKKKGAITTQRGIGKMVLELRGRGGGGGAQMPKEAKAEAAEKKNTRGTRRARSEKGGARRGLKRHAEAPTARTTRSWVLQQSGRMQAFW